MEPSFIKIWASVPRRSAEKEESLTYAESKETFVKIYIQVPLFKKRKSLELELQNFGEKSHLICSSEHHESCCKEGNAEDEGHGRSEKFCSKKRKGSIRKYELVIKISESCVLRSTSQPEILEKWGPFGLEISESDRFFRIEFENCILKSFRVSH